MSITHGGELTPQTPSPIATSGEHRLMDNTASPARADRAQAAQAEKLKSRRTLTGVLILPLFMVIFLPTLFIGLLHSPQPHDMKVAVIGSQATVGKTVTQLNETAGTSFDVKRVGSVADAKQELRHQHIRAAYNPVSGDLYTASAGGRQAAAASTAFFDKVAAQSHTAVTTHDVVAPDTHDPLATSALYIGIGAMAGGFMTAVILSLIPVSLTTRVVAGIAMPVIVAAVEVMYGWVLFDVFPGNGVAAGFAIFGLALVTCSVTMGLMTLAGPAMLIMSVLLLMFVGITASGVPVTLDMSSGFYQGMHDVIPTARGLLELKTVIYFHGKGIMWDVLTQVFWFVGGVIATAAGLVLKRRKAQAAAPTVFEAVGEIDEHALSGV